MITAQEFPIIYSARKDQQYIVRATRIAMFVACTLPFPVETQTGVFNRQHHTIITSRTRKKVKEVVMMKEKQRV